MDPKIDAEPLLQPEQAQPQQQLTFVPPPPSSNNNGNGIVQDEFVVNAIDPLPLRAEAQQPEYRDSAFAVGFILHLIVVLFLAFGWGLQTLKASGSSNNSNANDDEDAASLSGLLWLCCLTSLVSLLLSAGSLQIMSHHSETLIQTSLIASCAFMAVSVIGFFMDGLTVMGVVWLVLLLLTVLYARAVWQRIPFAAANLRTALSAVETNAGVCVLAYGIALAANVWVVLWCMAFVGVAFRESDCDANGNCQGSGNMDAISITLLVLSFHWTSQVLKNVLHVTVSGVVGTWWFAPQDCMSVWSPAIMDSFTRATSYSFGSICMGSLLVAVIQTLQSLARNARQRDGGGLLLCIVECILHFLANVAKYFNKWAYVYVGLYGYDYLTAGKKVLELFEARGWTTIINDNLVQRCLVLVALTVGAITGFVGLLLARATGWHTATVGEDSDRIVFLICFVVGFCLSNILMGVVLSAVDTVIVSFAEAPTEFETNHPALYQNMVTKWQAVYPDCGI